jgi:hypothetical protein
MPVESSSSPLGTLAPTEETHQYAKDFFREKRIKENEIYFSINRPKGVGLQQEQQQLSRL